MELKKPDDEVIDDEVISSSDEDESDSDDSEGSKIEFMVKLTSEKG